MSDFVKGVYMKKKTGKYGEYFVVSFKEDGLKNLAQIPVNEEGFRTIVCSPQKENPDKYSLKPFVKKDVPF